MKVAILADNPTILTGYGKIAYYFGKYLLRAGIEVVYFGLQHMGGPVYVRVEDSLIPLYSCYNGDGARLERCLKETQPDILVHIRDAFAHLKEFFPAAYQVRPICQRYGVKTILWTPVQSEPLPRQFAQACNTESDLTLVPTKWGREQLLWTGVPYNHMEVLPWGIDPEVYRKVEVDKTEFGFSENCVAIGSIGVPDQPRKNWAGLLLAFQKVKKEVPEAELFLNTWAGAYHIPHFIEALDLKGSVLMPAQYMKEWGMSEDDLIKFYSALDVYVSLSGAEGFNLPCLEAAACGTKVVVSEHPNHREILGDYPFYVKTYRIWPTAWSFDGLADPDDAAEKIIEALRSPRREIDLRGYYWDVIVSGFVRILEERGWMK